MELSTGNKDGNGPAGLSGGGMIAKMPNLFSSNILKGGDLIRARDLDSLRA